MKIPLSYFQSDDVVSLARDLLGKKLCTSLNGEYTSGIITETEAYRSWGDKACHAHLNRRTKRTEVMFEAGGLAYVYLCYGIHHLFNIVTNVEDKAEAILIRAIEPLDGLPIMAERRGVPADKPRLSAGPGNASMALGISVALNSTTLGGPEIWLEEHQKVEKENIVATTRVGIDYAGEDALHPWRFYIRNNPFVSRR